MRKKTILKHTDGREIHLSDTDDIEHLRNQLMLLGVHGLFYNEVASKIREKIEILEKEAVK